jgi:hypothetical protein
LICNDKPNNKIFELIDVSHRYQIIKKIIIKKMKTPLSNLKTNSEFIKNIKFNTPINDKKTNLSIKSIKENINLNESPTFNSIINSPTLNESPSTPDKIIKKLEFTNINKNTEKTESNVKKDIEIYDSPVPDELFDIVPKIDGEHRKGKVEIIQKKNEIKKQDTPLKILQKKASEIFTKKPSTKTLTKNDKKSSKNLFSMITEKRKSSKMKKKTENQGIVIFFYYFLESK